MVENYQQRFSKLSEWLRRWSGLWVPRPFVGLPVSWEADFPDLARVLRALSEAEIDELESPGPDFSHLPEDFQGWAQQAKEFSQWPDLAKNEDLLPQVARPRRVPGKKWEQVRHFAAACLTHLPAANRDWLDWCAGKGHLGRTLAAWTEGQVTCLEQNQALCQDGETLSAKAGLTTRFVSADVLADSPQTLLDPERPVAALHACGELHMRLMQSAVARGVAHLAVAPCCYHRISVDPYPPMSEAARQSGLTLGRHHLRLVAFDEVLASPKRKRLRRVEQAWRLGLDLGLGESSGEDRYRPLGPAPRSWFRNDFAFFCSQMAERQELTLPPAWHPAQAESRGWQRLRTVRALGLVRGLFRRPLETWLILDRVLYLQESGYHVQAGSFCPYTVTPRNLLIMAQGR